MKCLVIQLSDIHLKGPLDPILERAKQIAATSFRAHIASEATFIVLSGDIAFSGKAEEYLAAQTFLSEIKCALEQQRNTPVSIFAVPGNHDCDFTRDSIPREATIEHILANGVRKLDDHAVNTCTGVQDSFFEFQRTLEGSKLKAGMQRLYWSQQFDVAGRSIRFHAINCAWLSRLNEQYGRLQFPVDLFRANLQVDGEVNVYVLHHPINWFAQGNMQELKAALRDAAELVLSGHEHSQGAVMVDDALSTSTCFIEGGALSGDIDIPSSFNLLEIDLSTDEFRSSLYEFSQEEYSPREVSNAWSSFRSLPAKKKNGLLLSEEFLTHLRDPGANFKHPVRGALTLDDIYVFPDLRERQGDAESTRGRVSSNTLLGKGAAKRALLLGDEKSGKTSLLFQLAKRAHERGLAPLFVPGYEISTASERELDKAVDALLSKQYSASSIKGFWETDIDSRICLLDDFDRVRLNEKYRFDFLKYIERRFGTVLITSGEAYQLVEFLSKEAAEAFSTYKAYTILQFGRQLRYQLIKKWTCGGVEAVMPLERMTALVDHAERVIDGVLGRNFVPSAPLYLLTFLQSLEAGRATDLSQSAFGHYYSFLISRDFETIRVRPEELDEFFNYCAHLAFLYAKSGKRELPVFEVERFSAWYSDTFTKIRVPERIERLCEARVLMKTGEAVSFRYPYYRYYFLGKYYADNLNQPDQRDGLIQDIQGRCRNLHIRENANAILFLTHHSKEPFVLKEIVNVLSGLFSKHAPMRLEDDVKALGSLIETTSRAVLEDWDVEKNREEMRKTQDELEDAHSVEHGVDRVDERENSEVADAVSIFGELNLLFKTIELLGQVLKNYYGSLRNEEKLTLMREIFRGSMRALADFFEFLSEYKEALVQEVEADIARRDNEIPPEKRIEIARRTVFNVVGMISCAFVGKAADAVNASTLRDVARRCAVEEKSLAAQVIHLAAVLDSSESVPFEDLEAAIERAKNNIFAMKLIETFTFHHMYMFPTSIAEKQKLQVLLDFSVKGQRALDLKTKDLKTGRPHA